eukprot:m.166062 g.166062  ORF g.166062 m.166062 type:complete len:449 (-) comp18145_c0_seq3:169-1515(-)
MVTAIRVQRYLKMHSWRVGLALVAIAFFAAFSSSTPVQPKDKSHVAGLKEDPSLDTRRSQGDPWRAADVHQDSVSSDEIAAMKNKIKDMEELTSKIKTFPAVPNRNEFERKRILITGGAGFVGSHLVDKLMRQGHEVTVMDNFFTGRKKNIEQWIGHPNFELVHHDVVESYMIEVDEIYHLASPASPPHYMYNPIKTIKTNSIGTLNMLGLAHRVGARLLLASTSEVYGDPEVHPQNEDYRGNVNPIGPRACYDEGKRIAETMCYAYAKQGDVEVRVARIFNTFGPNMHLGDGRVVSNFIIQALQDKPITVYGEGQQTRSFQYVSDLVDGLVALMNGNYTLPVNLGNPDEYTMLEFATKIKEMTNSKSVIEHKPMPKDDPSRRKPDITRARTHLGWQPKVSVEDGLRKAIAYFKAELDAGHGAANMKDGRRAGPYNNLDLYKKNSQGL